MTQTVRVEGLADLLRVVDAEPKKVAREIRGKLREVAEPVRAEATARFLADITPDARKTRYGISVRKVGTISVEQRLRQSLVQSRRRPNSTQMQRRRALEPALANNEDLAVRKFQEVLDDLERRWNRAGVA